MPIRGDYCARRPCFAGNDLLHAASRFVPAPTTGGRGGIGRRAALRSLWGNPWKFESSRPHQLISWPLKSLRLQAVDARSSPLALEPAAAELQQEVAEPHANAAWLAPASLLHPSPRLCRWRGRGCGRPKRRVVEGNGDPGGLDEGQRPSRRCGGDRNRRDPATSARHKNGSHRVPSGLRSPGSGTG